MVGILSEGKVRRADGALSIRQSKGENMRRQKLLVTLVACLTITDCRAQQIDVPLAGRLDLGRVVSQTRASFVLDQHGNRIAGAHIPLVSFHDKSLVELVNLNGGVLYVTASGIGGPFVSIGGRIDNILRKWAAHPWAREHLSAVALPVLEVGPAAGYIHRVGWILGGFVAMPFGLKQ